PLQPQHVRLGDPVAQLAVGRVEGYRPFHLKATVVSRVRDGVLRESRRSGEMQSISLDALTAFPFSVAPAAVSRQQNYGVPLLYELADLVTVVPNPRPGRSTPPWASCRGPFKPGTRRRKTTNAPRRSVPGQARARATGWHLGSPKVILRREEVRQRMRPDQNLDVFNLTRRRPR